MKTMHETSGTEERTVHQGDAGSSATDFHGIVGRSAALQRVLRLVETVATTDAAILIRGETGTGKELIASLIHRLSKRRGGPLVKFNCTAIPAGLLESELFGHERGAFTSAIARRLGRFELANNGTLFLDEIGDLQLDLQPKLLRVLEEQAFERIGSTQMIRTDVRVIAATNRPLEELVEVVGETNGIVAGPRGAAVRLGLKRTTLLSKMEKLGITPDRAVSTPAQEKGRAVHRY